jgi:hypothetical protein
MRNFLLRLLHNRPQLLLLVLVLSAFPILRWFAVLLLALVTLRQGAKVGSQLVLAMMIPSLLLLFVSKEALIPVCSQLFETLLLFALAWLLRTTHSWLLLLQLLTMVGLVVVAGVHWVNPDIAATWFSVLKQEFALLKELPMMAVLEGQDIPLILDRLSHFSTGLQWMVLSAAALVNLAFGRYVQALLYNPGGLKQELYALHLQPVFASLMVGVMMLATFSQQPLLLDCLGVLMLPLVASGLSLLHYWTARFSWQSLWLVLFYIALLLFPPQGLLLLIGASFVDAWWNIRQRYAFKR